MNIKSRMVNLFYKLFIGGTWSIGYRDIENMPEKKYELVQVPEGQWAADPFIYEYAGEHYLFVEQYNIKENRAGIGYFHFENGVPVYKGLIITQPYHMSYPCVFEFAGVHYMIPESSANGTIDLYKAKRFPDKWVHEKTLLSGVKYVDSTVYRKQNEYTLLSYTKRNNAWQLVIFDLDMEKRELVQQSSVEFSRNTGRPAGLFFKQNGKIIRPSQDCSERYGKSLLLNEVLDDNSKTYSEREFGKLQSNDISIPVKHERIHTINSDSKYEVVDVFVEKIVFYRIFVLFKRAYLRKNRFTNEE